MVMRAAIAAAMGITKAAPAIENASSTWRISSVAYATEESASDENTGSARIFGSRVCSSPELATERPTRMRLMTPLEEPAGGLAVRDI